MGGLDQHVRWRAVEVGTDAGRTVVAGWYTSHGGIVRGERRRGDLTITVLATADEVYAVRRAPRPTALGRLVVAVTGAVCPRLIGHHPRHA